MLNPFPKKYLKIYDNEFLQEKMEIRALSSQSKIRKSFYTKVFPLFKNGQKNVQKRKPKILLCKKILRFLGLTENIFPEILIIVFLAYVERHKGI